MRVLHALDGPAVRQWCAAALDALAAHQREIDDLNVYPVPDRDTGTNLVLTLRAAADALRPGSEAAADALRPGSEPAPAALRPGSEPVEINGDLGAVLHTMAQGAILGARGNSGVIVGQLLRGLADGLPAGSAGGRALATALRHATEQAYAAVAEPVEGTILTVAAAAAAAAARAESDDLVVVACASAEAAGAALERTQSQLPALARAGVVDAGGLGLVVLLDALARVATGAAAGALPGLAAVPAGQPPADPADYAYEVQYLLAAEDAAVARLRTTLAGLGGSLAVVGTGAGQWNVHVHVNDIGAAVEAGIEAGRPSRIKVTRFADQFAGGRVAGSGGPAGGGEEPAGSVAVVAVAPGLGVADLFAAEGVVVVQPEPDGCPSAAEVAAGPVPPASSSCRMPPRSPRWPTRRPSGPAGPASRWPWCPPDPRSRDWPRSRSTSRPAGSATM